MHRYRSADRKLRQDRELGEWESRVGGEIFIVSASLLELSSRNPARALKFYKHFAPTALTILILAASFVSNAAFAQRRAQPATASSIPSPRSVLGFNPGDDRTIADWKQITDYFMRLDKASDRVQLQTIGTSTLDRRMFAAFISAPENIRNLEKYKTIQ